MAAVPTLLGIAFFVVGAVIGTWLMRTRCDRPRRLIFGLVVVCLVFHIAVAELHAATVAVQIGVLTVAMGILNTSVSRVGTEALSLTFVTGTLSKMGTHLALAAMRARPPDARAPWDTHRRRAAVLAGIWGVFLLGALMAAAAMPHLAQRALFLPILILLGLAVSNPAVPAQAAKSEP